MWERVFAVLIILAAICIVCKILVDYWLHSVVKMPTAEFTKLGFWNRMAFGIDDFCRTMLGAKNLRREWMEETMGSVPTDVGEQKYDTSSQYDGMGREQEAKYDSKTHRMKEDM